MTQRLDYARHVPDLVRKLAELGRAVKQAVADPTLVGLVEIRASQLNGCAFCLDLHVKEATLKGERPLRIHHLAVWSESPLFSAREKAALAWTEALTHLHPHGVPDELYGRVREHFSDAELSALTFAVMTINAWNRAGVAFRTAPGSADALYGLDKANLS